MDNNPFYDASVFISNEKLSDKLMDAAIMWDSLTDSGKNVKETDVYTVLNAFDLEDILLKYELYRKNEKEFDSEALKKSVSDWSFEV